MKHSTYCQLIVVFLLMITVAISGFSPRVSATEPLATIENTSTAATLADNTTKKTGVNATVSNLLAWILRETENSHSQISPRRIIDHGYTFTRLFENYPAPVFTAGPHQNGRFNFRSTEDFGHYNPVFLRWFIDDFLPRVELTAIYDKFLKLRLRALHDQRQFLLNNPEETSQYLQRYQNAIAGGKDFYFFNLKARTYEGKLMIAFWLRRDMDGTTGYFDEIVKQLLERYDNDFWLTRSLPVEGDGFAEASARVLHYDRTTRCPDSDDPKPEIPASMFGRIYHTTDSPYALKESKVRWQQWSLSAHPQGRLRCFTNGNLWIFNGGKKIPGSIGAPMIVTRPSGMTALEFVMTTILPLEKGNLVYLSTTPIPQQTWNSSKTLTEDHASAMSKFAQQLGIEQQLEKTAGIEIKTKNKKTLLLVNYHLNQNDSTDPSRPNDYNSVITLLLAKSSDGGWKLENEIRDAHFKFPFVDVDGDGIPEFMGETGFRSEILMSLDKKAPGEKAFTLVFDSGL